MSGIGPSGTATPTPKKPLAKSLDIERACVPDREAMLAALRVVLGLPRVVRTHGQEPS